MVLPPARFKAGKLTEGAYVFGLASPPTDRWLLQKWAEYAKDDVDGFVDAVLAKTGPHILPHLVGEEEAIQLLRHQHLAMLTRAFSRAGILQILKAETILALTRNGILKRKGRVPSPTTR